MKNCLLTLVSRSNISFKNKKYLPTNSLLTSQLSSTVKWPSIICFLANVDLNIYMIQNLVAFLISISGYLVSDSFLSFLSFLVNIIGKTRSFGNQGKWVHMHHEAKLCKQLWRVSSGKNGDLWLKLFYKFKNGSITRNKKSKSHDHEYLVVL